MPVGASSILLGAWFLFSGGATHQVAAPTECTEWQECRDQVEQAIASGAVERAHDLAWRAVQRGPKDDAALMFLLARAQSLAGRPHDALVMVRRIAERGVATEAATHPDLARLRALPGWAEVEAVAARVNAGEPAAETKPVPKPGRSEEPKRSDERGPAKPPAAPSSTTERRGSSRGSAVATPVEEAARFTTDGFVGAGLAYDAVSRRYLFGDQHGRKLRVVGEGLDHAVDLVRSESAGFLDVRALAIDTRRGDLWVASANAEGTTATLHKLQLVSGRPLMAVPFEVDDTPVVPVDLAVTADGAVLALDGSGGLHRLRPGASTIETLVQLPVGRATSLAPAASDGVWFVAHEAGLSRVDLPSRGVTALGSPKDVSLAAFERIRAYRDGLVGIQADADGVRRIVQLALNGSRRSVRTARTFDTRIEASAGPAFLAVSGDELSFVTTSAQPFSPTPAGASPAREPTDLVVRRLRLR